MTVSRKMTTTTILYLLCLCSVVSCDCISLLCSSPLNPTDYVTYTCYTGYVNSFLEWSVVDSSGNVIVDFVFSSSDEVGSNHFQDNFLGVLTDKTNSLTSILTFKATTDRNNSHVICGLKNTSCKKECKITIKGAPSKTVIMDVQPYGNKGHVAITWKSLSSTFRILYYIVNTSDNRTKKQIGTKTCVEMKFNVGTQEHYVTVTGVDFAEKVGEESDRYYFILDKPNVTDDIDVTIIYCKKKLKGIIFWKGDNTIKPNAMYSLKLETQGVKYDIGNTENTFIKVDLEMDSFSENNINLILTASNVYGSPSVRLDSSKLNVLRCSEGSCSMTCSKLQYVVIILALLLIS